MRRFYLRRLIDETGVSGTGVITEGVEFEDGTCVMRWLTDTSSIAIYRNIDDLLDIHGHSGKTLVASDISDDTFYWNVANEDYLKRVVSPA